MNDIPDFIDDVASSEELKDIRYCVLDYGDVHNVDYIFIPLLFLESFNAPAVDIQIGTERILMPLDWSVVIGDKNSGELEVIELKKLVDRSFQTFTINPISGFMPDFMDLEIVNIYPDMKWYFPKLKFGHILAVPLKMGHKPMCGFFCKDINRIPDQLDITQMV